MGVSFIPPEFFGVSGLGKSLGEIGDQRREDEEVARREKQQKLASTLAVEEAAISKFKAINELALQTPGDQGLALRQLALDSLAGANMVGTDVRLELSAEDINANQETLALATPGDVRTPEQWLLIGNRLGLAPGFTPETAKLTVERNFELKGFDLTRLRDSEEAREEYKTAAEAAGQSPGQIQFDIDMAGLEDRRAGTSLVKSQEALADSQVRLNDVRIESLLGTGASDLAKTRLQILGPFLDEMAKNGVDGRTAFKFASGTPLTEDEQAEIVTSLEISARAAEDIPGKMKLLADLLKIKELDGGLHTVAIAGIVNEVFGPDVFTATPLTGRKFVIGPKKEGFETSINLPLALSRMLSEDGKTGPSQQTMKDAVVNMQKDIQSINSLEEIEVEIAALESEGVESFALAPIMMQMLQERALELDGGAAEVTEVQPEGVSGLSEEETIREEQKLRQELTEADAAGDKVLMSDIRKRLLELERHRQSDFPTFSAREFEDLRAQKNELNKKRAALETAPGQIESFRTGRAGPNDKAIASVDAAIARIDAEIAAKQTSIRQEASGGLNR